uniref:Integrin beta n=1 Tax=Salarias fasciatus TaxID=181472 RepID=A0A672I7J9_SALFA
CSECLQVGTGCAYCPDEVESAKLQDGIRSQNKVSLHPSCSQVSPQQVSMSFLPGEEKEVDVQVFAPTKGPLDLYILMDFSNSMEDDLDNLKSMGKELASLVEKLSNNYTIGFGKFVDKVIEPQTDMRPSKLKQPWPNSDPPFSFQNVIRLTSKVDFFISELQKERISGNLDAPEGGFDAILQAAVCTDNIGWRPESTHLLVFSTESAFHYEADGANVLSGILPRNDEQCHLDGNDKYTEDIYQDYPSIPTLIRVLGKHNIIPIFAVTNHSYTYYKKLQEYFPIAEVGLLQEDSSNILQVMEIAFENIRSKMSIRAEEKPKAFEAQFLYPSGSVAEYGAFDFKPGAIVGSKQTSDIHCRMVNEELVCKMDEEDKEGMMRTRIAKAERCYGNGDLVCGKCFCYDGWVSTFCNCSASSSALDTSQCIGPNMTEPCSGRGECMECGTCVCYNPDQFEGPYCQYDKTRCQRYGGFLCNDRGSCVMGRCACAEGWEGNACECPKSTQTCLDSKGGVCNGRGKCVCGRCLCPDSGIEMTSTCEPNFEAQLGVCEATRSCVQCQAWKTGEKKKKEDCDKCLFKVIMVDELKEREQVLDSCSYRDEDDDCTYHYTVESPKDSTVNDLEVQVLKKKDCPAASLLWLLPLILFLLLLLALLALCCWKYCACCKTSTCLVLSPGRMVGFTEDAYMYHQSQLMSDHVDTPMARTGPPKGTDVVRWKVTDNVHRPFIITSCNFISICFLLSSAVPFPLSLRLNRLFSENLSRPESRDAEQLRKEVADNLNEVYKHIPGAQKIQKTVFRLQQNAGKRRDNAIVDTVLSAPRSSFPDIVKLTEKNVQSGRFQDLKVVPGYYTVETDRGVCFQEGVESEDDNKKKLLVEAIDVPLGIAEIGKRLVNITIIKDQAASIFSFLQPQYSYSRQDGVAHIPDYVTVEGDLNYNPGETQKIVPVRLLELNERDGLLEEKQVKQFTMELSNPRQGGKLGRYPKTTVTITDLPGISTQKATSPGGHLTSPGNPRAKATGPRSIRLNWDPPPGNPKGYKVKYWIYGDPEKDAQVLDVKTNHADLTNLYPYCDYEMRVCGYNAIGDGYDTDVVTCQTMEDVPGEPGRLAFNVISPTVTQLSWGEPAETNGNITAYEVVYTPIDDDMKPVGAAKKVKIDNPKKRMLLIENLQNAQTYQYKVRAKNSVGWGPFRDATINLASQPARPLSKILNLFYCLFLTVPIIPDIPIVDAEAGDEYDSFLAYSNEVLKSPASSKTPSVSDFTMNGKWDQNFLFPGGTATRNLSASSSPMSTLSSNYRVGGGGGGSFTTETTTTYLTGPGEAVSLRWSDERNIINVTIYLRCDGCVRVQGAPAGSARRTECVVDPSDARLSPGIPDTPSRLVFSALGPTALKVSWQEPHCEKDILGYSVLYQLLNGGETKRINVTNPAENSVIIQDLLPNHSYLFKVKAQSQEGWGPEREGVITIESAVDPKSPLSPMPGSPFTLSTPSAPGPLVFTALSPESLQLSWEKPRKPNGDILGYVVTCEQLHDGGDARSFQVNGDNAETSLTVPNLLENVPYKFKVQARTTLGFGPEREGIITIESQDGGTPDPFNTSGKEQDVHSCMSPSGADGMMMTSQHMETSGMVTRQITKEVVQRSVMGGTTVTKKMFPI